MKHFLLTLSVLLGLWSAPALAQSDQTVGEVKLELINNLQTDGFLSERLAQDAREKYVNPDDLRAKTTSLSASAEQAEPSFLDRYVSWSNAIKVAGVVLLLVAFSGWISQLASKVLFLIVAVPKELYQVVFLGATWTGLLAPSLLWPSQAFYLALFSAFANLSVLAWVVKSHPKLKVALEKLFSFGLPAMSVLSFFAMLYFGALALHYQSEIFGFFAAVALSGVFTFGMYYRPGVLILDFDEKATPAVVLGHLAVLAGYSVLAVQNLLPQQAQLFSVGLQYYCTIAMGVGFLVAASPFQGRKAHPAGFLVLFLVVLQAALFGYFMFDLKVIGSIVCVFAVLLTLEWVAHLSYRAGFLAGTFVMGVSLYLASLAMESFGNFIVLRLA